MNVYLEVTGLPLRSRNAIYTQEQARQVYYQKRNAQAAKAHRKKRRAKFRAMGIDTDKIKSESVIDKPQK